VAEVYAEEFVVEDEEEQHKGKGLQLNMDLPYLIWTVTMKEDKELTSKTVSCVIKCHVKDLKNTLVVWINKSNFPKLPCDCMVTQQ
jgi:hypothetical protein